MRTRFVASAGAGAIVLGIGCAQIIGLDEWKDPAGPGGGGASVTSTDTSATTASNTGGSGGSSTISAGGSGGGTTSSTTSSHTTSSSTTSSSSTTTGGEGGASPTCNDGVRNGPETDVDCGGDCDGCAGGLKCGGDADCLSQTCLMDGTCAVMGTPSPCIVGSGPSCHDCLVNGDETDVDCGGDGCLPCLAGKLCSSGFDCISGVCTGGVCASGGSGKPCQSDADCASGTCTTGSCWTGSCCQ